MTKIKIKNFQAKKVKIENFELQKRYIPQNKAENIYNSVSAQKRKNFCKKKYFLKFFWFSRHARGPPEIFDVQFFKNFQKKSKNGFTGVYQTLKGTKSWILVNLAQTVWKWQTVSDRPGTKCPPSVGIGLKWIMYNFGNIWFSIQHLLCWNNLSWPVFFCFTKSQVFIQDIIIVF